LKELKQTFPHQIFSLSPPNRQAGGPTEKRKEKTVNILIGLDEPVRKSIKKAHEI
jgi:hypothetical protein